MSFILAFYSFFLQKANVTVLSDSTCRDSYGQGDIADSMICVEVILYTLSHMSCNKNFCKYLWHDMHWGTLWIGMARLLPGRLRRLGTNFNSDFMKCLLNPNLKDTEEKVVSADVCPWFYGTLRLFHRIILLNSVFSSRYFVKSQIWVEQKKYLWLQCWWFYSTSFVSDSLMCGNELSGFMSWGYGWVQS